MSCAEGWNCPAKFMRIVVDGEALNAERGIGYVLRLDEGGRFGGRCEKEN